MCLHGVVRREICAAEQRETEGELISKPAALNLVIVERLAVCEYNQGCSTENCEVREYRIIQHPVPCPASTHCFGLTDLYMLRGSERFNGK
jgi:hypothetical protein